MPEYLAPGVFVEEVSFRPSQIAPASTSVAALVGPTRTGPVRGRPLLLTSFNDYVSIFGDADDLTFRETSVHNYTAYSARAFFDNGGQQLYLARVANDVAQAGDTDKRAAAAARALKKADNTTVATFHARFPGAAGNVTLRFEPRRSPKLLQVAPAGGAATGALLLRLSDVASIALDAIGTTLDQAYPLKSLIAVVTPPAPPAAPPEGADDGAGGDAEAAGGAAGGGGGADGGGAGGGGAGGGGGQPAYRFVDGSILLYVDKNGATKTVAAPPGSGVLASAVEQANLSVVTVKAPSGFGDAPLYSIPVGPTTQAIFGLNAGNPPSVLYGSVSDGEVTVSKALNPALAANRTVHLATLALSARAGDGNLHHDTYDIAVLNAGGREIYSFANAALEPEAPNAIYKVLSADPTGAAAARQPVSVAKASGATASGFLEGLVKDTSVAGSSAPDFAIKLEGGSDGAAPHYADYVGEVDQLLGSYGLAALESVDEISIVVAPAAAADETIHKAVITAIQAHCGKMLYRVGVIDSPSGATIADAQVFAGQFSDSRLAYYYPWIEAASLSPDGGTLLLPPSGFMAGLYAATDISRGVHKAPANEVVVEALGLETYVNTPQQMVLNPHGVNCIRYFPGRGIRVWGARTLAAEAQWQYVNVRRYFLYLEKSIAQSTDWVVFEPNGPALWSAVAGTVNDFLYNEWFNGRLLGARPNQAYFVRCDQTTMTEADLENGRLICVIGVSPVEPAEFVIFRIGQWTASAS